MSAANAGIIDATGMYAVPSRSSALTDYGIATSSVIAIALVSMWWSKPVTHWFLLPSVACGILAGVDIVRWMRGRLDLFDPQTGIACLAFHGFFLTPILHVAWDRFGVGDIVLFGDTRPWLGAMGWLNALGLLAYRAAQFWSFRHTRSPRNQWRIDRKKFYPLFALALALSTLGLAAFLWQLDGISGLIQAYEENQIAFAGKGWLLVFAWPFAVLAFIVLVFALTDRQLPVARHFLAAIILLSVAGIGHFLFLGWYGNRVATLSALFWMAGIVHYRVRRFPRVMLAIGLVSLICFAYFYGFYKERGRIGLEVLGAPGMWVKPAGYQRDIKYLLLDDLARIDSNALILHNLVKDPQGYKYRWGATYLGAFSILIPRYFWEDRPYFRVEAGTEALWGHAVLMASSRLYGLAGEALLNFGAYGVVPVFALYGALLGCYRRKFQGWSARDARMFLAPFITSLFVEALLCDSDVLIFFVVTQAFLIFVTMFFASNHVAVKTPAAESA
jgi:hypothetical protein